MPFHGVVHRIPGILSGPDSVRANAEIAVRPVPHWRNVGTAEPRKYLVVQRLTIVGVVNVDPVGDGVVVLADRPEVPIHDGYRMALIPPCNLSYFFPVEPFLRIGAIEESVCITAGLIPHDHSDPGV